MWKHPCAACMGLMISGVRAVFNMNSCPLFPQCLLAFTPLVRGGTGVVMARGCVGYGAPWCLLIQALITFLYSQIYQPFCIVYAFFLE